MHKRKNDVPNTRKAANARCLNYQH